MKDVLVGSQLLNVFPTILIFEILLLFPVRSLLQFRCVCKEWCELIDSRLFRDAYLAIRRAMDVDDRIVGLHYMYVSIPIILEDDEPLNDEYVDDAISRSRIGDNITFTLFKYSMTGWCDDYESLARYAYSALAPSLSSSNMFQLPGNSPDALNIVGHVNGIVCINNGESGYRPMLVNPTRLVHGGVDIRLVHRGFDIRLVNPALREVRRLPDPMFDLCEFCSKRNLGGSFEYEIQGIGFGYDDVTDDYKVVVIVTVVEATNSEEIQGRPYKHIGMVYRLSTNSWEIYGDMSEFVSRPFIPLSQRHVESLFSHGSIHWCMSTDIGEKDPYYWILVFDVSNELFREMGFPHGWTSFRGLYSCFINPHIFKVDKSTIALVNSTQDTSDIPEFQVWVMNEYGDSNSWTKQNSIYNFEPFYKAKSLWKKDKLLLSSPCGNLICYDLSKGQLDLDDDADIYIQRLDFVTGYESLVSVKQVL